MFAPIVERAARLICTTPAFDDLAREIGLSPIGTAPVAPAEALHQSERPAPIRAAAPPDPTLASAPQLFAPVQPSLGDAVPAVPVASNEPPATVRPVYGLTDPAQRARLRAELDGIIAHLYGLTEEEFAHILSTFPLVATAAKLAAQNAYRDVARGILP